MGQTISVSVVKPEYYDKFKCAMAACEYNCCKRGWEIVIDKSTYLKYRNVKDPVFHAKQKECVKRIKDTQVNNMRYARYVFADGKLCPFQTKEGLCEIHRDLGEDFMCRTCRVYPRKIGKMVPEYVEMALSMSCPQVVRIALFDEKPMEFNMETVEFKKNDPILKSYARPIQGKAATSYIEHGWAMREAAITIMQKRTCPVAYRLIVIAMMLDEVVARHDENKAEEIPEVLDYYSQGEYGDSFVKQFDDLEANDDLKLQMNVLLYHSIGEKFSKLGNSIYQDLKNRYEQNAQAKGLSKEQTDSAMEYHAYIWERIAESWSTFNKKWGHVLENYFVNLIFTEIFPLRYLEKDLNPYHHAFLLAEQYALLRMLICGNVDDEQGLTDEYITHTIFQLSLINQHSQEPLVTTKNYKLIGIDTPAHLYFMLI